MKSCRIINCVYAIRTQFRTATDVAAQFLLIFVGPKIVCVNIHCVPLTNKHTCHYVLVCICDEIKIRMRLCFAAGTLSNCSVPVQVFVCSCAHRLREYLCVCLCVCGKGNHNRTLAACCAIDGHSTALRFGRHALNLFEVSGKGEHACACVEK